MLCLSHGLPIKKYHNCMASLTAPIQRSILICQPATIFYWLGLNFLALSRINPNSFRARGKFFCQFRIKPLNIWLSRLNLLSLKCKNSKAGIFIQTWSKLFWRGTARHILFLDAKKMISRSVRLWTVLFRKSKKLSSIFSPKVSTSFLFSFFLSMKRKMPKVFVIFLDECFKPWTGCLT